MVSKAKLLKSISTRKAELRYKRDLIEGLKDSILRLEYQYQNEEQGVVNCARRVRQELKDDCLKLESIIYQMEKHT